MSKRVGPREAALRAAREAQAVAERRVNTALAISEMNRLDQLETLIERGLSTFVEVGQALAEVRDSRLYRQAHATFEDYCRDRWQMARNYANKLIAASETVSALGTIVPNLPRTESQARPLTRLEPEQQREAWQQAVETAPRTNGGEPQVTAEHIESVVREFEGKPKMAVHYSSDTPEWTTPAHIVEAVIAALGAIDLDPCSNDGEPNVPAANHFTVADDGLVQDWSGRVYMNPPYGDVIPDWTGKLVREFSQGSVTEAVALVPARTDTKWFAELFECAICFVRGRLKFSDAETSAPFPSAAVYFGADVERFAEAFKAIGPVVVRYE